MKRIEKPNPDEFAPYANQYIGLLPDDGLVLEHLRTNAAAARELLSPLSEEKLRFRYAEGKWTIKEILQHITDDERIFAYRALRFARGDATELPGFDQDEYARSSAANARSIESLLDEFDTVREGTISLFEGLAEETHLRSGIASGNVMSVRAIAYHIAGHELRHLDIIRERYI
jgi:uncharacterized damage-inducible protein DinB